MSNSYTGSATLDSANIISETKETLHPTNLLEAKLEPYSPHVNTQESCPSKRINDEHNYTLSLGEARQKLENELNRKEITLKNLRKKCSVHKKRCNRQESSIRKLELALSSAKQKNLVSEHLLHALNNNLSSILLEIISRASGEQNTEYSEALKRFALNVYCYSPAAYRHLRDSFEKCLPHVNRIRKWRAAIRLTPNTKHDLSTAVKNQVRDTEDQAFLTQGIGNQTVMSPDLENKANVSPHIENQAVWSHNLMDHDTILLTPVLEDQAISLSDIEDKAIL